MPFCEFDRKHKIIDVKIECSHCQHIAFEAMDFQGFREWCYAMIQETKTIERMKE